MCADMCVSTSMCASCVFFSLGLFFVFLFVLSYFDFFLFCLTLFNYYSLKACLFNPESKEGGGLQKEGKTRDLGGIGEGEDITKVFSKDKIYFR